MRSTTPFALLLVALLASLSSGCDRGTRPGQIGDRAPDFVIHDGPQTVQLSAYRGKIVLLNFWASWCQPCLEELPSLMELQRRMPQMVVLTVSMDEDEAVYRRFLAENHIDILSIRDPQENSNRLYGSFRPPESYLIDRGGIIRRKFIGAQDWTSPELRAYLSSL